MSNIILPKVQILDTISDEAKILIEQDGEINRFAVTNLGGGDISINLEDTIYGDANPINADTLGGYPVKTFVKQNEITDRVIYGKGKNLLKNTAKSQTINGVTFTVNDDGSVTANGTASNASSAYIAIPITLTIGEGYIVSGCPAGGSNDSYQIYVTDTTFNSDFPDFGQGKTFTAKYEECIVRVLISKGYTVNNLTFYPMIRLASETDDTYEPYYEGLKNLTDRGMELLWENASPTSAFPAQSINLDLTKSQGIRIKWHWLDTDTSSWCSDYFVGDINGYESISFLVTAYRSVKVYTDRVEFGGATKVGNYGIGSGNEANNSYLIPTEIYGIKGVSA